MGQKLRVKGTNPDIECRQQNGCNKREILDNSNKGGIISPMCIIVKALKIFAEQIGDNQGKRGAVNHDCDTTLIDFCGENIGTFGGANI